MSDVALFIVNGIVTIFTSGITYLFALLAALYLIATNWHKTKRLFFMWLAGLAIIVIFALMADNKVIHIPFP